MYIHSYQNTPNNYGLNASRSSQVGLLTNHVPSLQYPEEPQVQVLLVESSSSLLGFAGGWVEGDTLSCHEVFQMRPLQLGHPLKGAFEKDKIIQRR